jgi:hypothetical protein
LKNKITSTLGMKRNEFEPHANGGHRIKVISMEETMIGFFIQIQ